MERKSEGIFEEVKLEDVIRVRVYYFIDEGKIKDTHLYSGIDGIRFIAEVPLSKVCDSIKQWLEGMVTKKVMIEKIPQSEKPEKSDARPDV